MVTNRKTEPTTARASVIVVDAPRDSFVGVLRRRASGEDLETLTAERLARWDELGRQLAASGWHHLEIALENARVTHDHATHARFGSHDPNTERFSTHEAEGLAECFVADCRRIVAAGGAEELWHILVTDKRCTHDSLDRVDAEKLGGNDPHECALLLDAARCFALAAFATDAAMRDREDARVLFGTDCDEDTLDGFAPFAIDGRIDDRDERLMDAACVFASGRTNAARLQATMYFAVGMEGCEERYSLSPVQRMGLVAWLARRGLDLTMGGAA